MKINARFQTAPNLYRLMRRLGYRVHPHVARKGGEVTYIKTLGRDLYPRFHLYVKHSSETVYELNLHLDSKKASYGGQKSHSGEYDSEVVELEATRIKQVLGM